MSAKSVSPKDQLWETTRKTLSKYGTPQLLNKLRSGAFLKMSKDVAIALLEQRSVDVSEFKVNSTNTSTTEPATESVTEAKEEEVKTPPLVKESKKKQALKEKIAQVPKKVKDKVITSTFVAIDETDPAVSKIINSALESSKTDKIKALLRLGYTANQISKTSLNAHYSFCFTIKTKMEAEANDSKK